MRIRLDAFVLHIEASCGDAVIRTFASCIHEILSMQTSYLASLPLHMMEHEHHDQATQGDLTSCKLMTLVDIWVSCSSLVSQLQLLCRLCQCQDDATMAAPPPFICSSVHCSPSKCWETQQHLRSLGLPPSNWELGSFPSNGQDLLDNLYQGNLSAHKSKRYNLSLRSYMSLLCPVDACLFI